MPKEGLPAKEWETRLRDFAAGRYTFGRGQQPGRTSVWHAKLNAIKACPLQGRSASSDVLGRRLQCNCGYHMVSLPHN